MTTTWIEINDEVRSCMQCDNCIHGYDYTKQECAIHGLIPDDILHGKRRCPDMKIEDAETAEMVEKCIAKWYPDIAR